MFGHWKTENEIHLDSQKFFNKLHNNAFLVQDLAGKSIETTKKQPGEIGEYGDDYDEELDHYDGFQEGVSRVGWGILFRNFFAKKGENKGQVGASRGQRD